MRFTETAYDPVTKETFKYDPRSIEKSYVTIGAEGYVLCKMGDGTIAWLRKLKRWKKRFKSRLKARRKRSEK